MLLAIVGTLLHHGIVDYKWIAIALVLGTIIGVPLGRVQMTAVPQRTALSHAFGALCVTLVGTAEFYLRAPDVAPFMMAVLSMEVILGSLTFTGSLMAAGKLQEVLPQRPITYKGQNIVNLWRSWALAVVVAVILVFHPEQTRAFPADRFSFRWSSACMMIIPIGGADMPTVISLLEFLRRTFRRGDGLCADSKLLIIAGALDGASGFILSVNHVEGHEPFVHERAVRRRSDKCRRRPPARRKRRRCAAPRPRRPRVFWPRRAKWSSCRATAWPSRKRNIRCANFTIR